MSQQSSTRYLLKTALLQQGWVDNVCVTVNADGMFESVTTDHQSDSDSEYQCIDSTVVPGIANCHSHAHQRAMAGLGEKATIDSDTQSKATDSFWTWRKVMYHYLERIKPEHLYAISKQLYIEMLRSGYTNIAEFQYLHHDINGQAYANPAEMTLQCMSAANDIGIGFTALPVLYRYGGFGGQDSLEGQKRFINDSDRFCDIVERLFDAAKDLGLSKNSVGIAPHSLRAVTDELLRTTIENLSSFSLAAIHIHIAEQTREVEDCLDWSGERPVEWLLNRFSVDESWCAIHATHMTEKETIDLAKTGAVAGLCPTTEGNLGDGFFNINEYLAANGNWAIGSDSHISIDPVEELRWLEYGRRLVDRQRNIMASTNQLHTGASLLEGAVAGGAQSSGLPIGQIAPDYRADFVVLDEKHPRLYGRQKSDLVDSWIFSGNENLVKDVYVAGKVVIQNGRHADQDNAAKQFKKAIDELSSS